MTRIKPRTRGKHLVRRTMQLDRQNDDTLHAYAAFIGEDADYVLNQLVDAILARDKDFVKWRANHPGPFPSRGGRRTGRRATGAAMTNRALTAPSADGVAASATLVS